MSGVRVLVGTRKGAFVLTADGARKEWEVRGPFFPGLEVYHLDASPADPTGSGRRPPAAGSASRSTAPTTAAAAGSRSAASSPTPESPAPTSGTTARRTRGSSPGCGTWSRPPTTRTPCWPGSRTPRCSARSTAAAPGRSCPGCASTAPARTGSPAPGACACTRSCPTRATADRMLVAISAAGVFRTDDGGKSWRASNSRPGQRGHPGPGRRGRALRAQARRAPGPARDRVYMQKHWDVMRSDDGGEHWHDIGDELPSDFGFVVDVHAHEPDTVYVLPITQRLRALSRPRAGCGCTAAAPAAASGSR